MSYVPINITSVILKTNFRLAWSSPYILYLSGAYKINDNKEHFITDAKLSGHPSLSPEMFKEFEQK